MVISEIKTPEDIKEFLEEIGETMMQNLKREQTQKVENYKVLNAVAEKGQILFTGSSLMEQFPICELCQSLGLEKKVYNRGIGGTTTEDFLREIDTVLLELEPSKVFINIGTNDMNRQYHGEQWMEVLLKNYEKILRIIKEHLQDTEVYVMAYYPVNDAYAEENPAVKGMLEVRTKENLDIVNHKLEELAKRFGYHFLDANKNLTDNEGKLKLEYTVEGVHMYAKAYQIVFDNLKEYLLEEVPMDIWQ